MRTFSRLLRNAIWCLVAGLSGLSGLSGLGGVAGGSFSPADIGSLLAEYDFLQGADPLVLYDKSSNAAHGTVVSGVSWSSYGLTTASGSKWATTGVRVVDVKTIRYYVKPIDTSGPPTFASATTPGTVAPVLSEFIGTLANGDLNPRVRCLDSNADTTANTNARHNAVSWPFAHGYTFGNPVKQYVDGVESLVYDAQSNASSYTMGTEMLRFANGYNNSSSAAMLLCYAVLYSDVKTAAQVQLVDSYMAQRVASRGVPAGGPAVLSNDLLVFTGNSITNLMPMTNIVTAHTFDKMKQGLGGASLSQVLSLARQATQPLRRPLATRSYCVFWPSAILTSTADVDNYVTPYAAELKAQGWKVAVPTMLSWSGEGSIKATVNNYLKAVAAAPGAAFSVIDLTSIAEISADGAYANRTWFRDDIHPADAAYSTYIEPALSAGVDAMG